VQNTHREDEELIASDDFSNNCLDMGPGELKFHKLTAPKHIGWLNKLRS